jgi:hypothetical protein
MTAEQVKALADRVHELACNYAGRVACNPEDGTLNRRRWQDSYKAFTAGYAAASEDAVIKPAPVPERGAKAGAP